MCDFNRDLDTKEDIYSVLGKLWMGSEKNEAIYSLNLHIYK